MQRILDFLFPPRVDELVIRNATREDFVSILRPILVTQTNPETTALLPLYDPIVRAAVHEAKYHGNTKAFLLLAVSLSEFLTDADMNIKKCVVVPVPLGEKRQKERGFNQIEEVARSAAKKLPLTIDTKILKRTRETDTQIGLRREKRLENMCRAFTCAYSASPHTTYILIDDVVTTGATLQACIDALSSAGASHIVPLALAH